MTVWIALLRGINVGGANVLPMRELVSILEEQGCDDVRTWIQSGNALFLRDIADRDVFAARLGEAVLAEKGFRPRVLLLTRAELVAAAERNPFPNTSPRFLHLFFLDAEPDAVDVDGLQGRRADSERYRLDGRVFYLSAPDGIARSKLAERVEHLLGVSATARNLNTVSKLVELAGELSSRC